MNEEAEQPKDEQIPLRFRVPSNMSGRLSQHLLIQDLGEIVQLSFFEVVNPLVTPENAQDTLSKLKESGIIAECVARIYVPASRFPAFSEAMQRVADIITSDIKEDANG